MYKQLSVVFKMLTTAMVVASCTLPRGAALQSEVLSKSNVESTEFAVYEITKPFIPIVSKWPANNGKSYNWINHHHSNATAKILPGDTINLTIWDSEENSLLTSVQQKVVEIENVVVSRDGTVFVPYLDRVSVAGMTDEAAREKIQTQLSRIIPSAQLQLTTIAGTNRSVSLVSGVANPGSYVIDSTHFTILNLISLGGGPSADLRNPRVKLVRAGRTYNTSLSEIYDNPNFDIVLKGGDKVLLQSDNRYFRALGATGNESIISFEKNSVSALDALSLVGGLTDNRANPKGILIMREYPKSAVRHDGLGPKNTRSVFVIDLTRADGIFSAGKFQINSEDTVLVTESPITAIRTVFGVIGSVFGVANDLN